MTDKEFADAIALLKFDHRKVEDPRRAAEERVAVHKALGEGACQMHERLADEYEAKVRSLRDAAAEA